MLANNEDIPLLKCLISHTLPGRIRIACRALRYIQEHNCALETDIAGLNGVTNFRVSYITGNVLVYFDSESTNSQALLESVGGIISRYSLTAYKGCRTENNKLTVQERDLSETSVASVARETIGIAATLLVSLLRPAVTAPSTLLGRLTTLPAIGAIGFSLPMFRSGFGVVAKTHRPNADTLGAVAVISSLLTGRDISALTVIFLHQLSELITLYTMRKTRTAIRDMLATGEDFVWKQLPDSSLEKTPLEQIVAGDYIVVHAGEKISVDGEVCEGRAWIDQSSITGEFMPAARKQGEQVFAGTVIKDGVITVQAQKVGEQTAVSKIIHMVEDASSRRASIQTYADRFSSALVPLNFILAGAVLMATRDPVRALNMLVIDYSCGIRLSTATALSSAITTAARNGILIKGCNFIEMLSESDSLILDKTGTLTEGKPQVVSVVPVNSDVSRREIIELAAAAEETSKHPMAAAIISKLRSSGWSIPKHGTINTIVARGVQTEVGESIVRVGNKRFMNDNKIHTHPLREQATSLSLSGENVVFVARDDQVIGVLGIHDPLRENMKKAINRLRYGIGIDDLILLTGDLEQQAEVVANRMGMDRFEYELLPEDKAGAILKLQSNGVVVTMVGDGINDAPGLAYSDIGIALGSSRTDIAMEAADITIAGDNPLMLPALYSLSRETMSIIKQNFATAIGVNSLGLFLGGLGVLPVFWGAVLHNSSTIMVVANSLRLLFYDMKKRG